MDRSVAFSQVCALFDKIQRSRTVHSKKTIVQKYLNSWRRSDPDCYPLLRLLLPHMDERSRESSYGVRESKLAEVYVSCLSLSKTSADAFALRRFEQHGGPKSNEDFADVLHGILKTRLFQEHSSLVTSVGDVNEFLDRLSAEHSDHKPLFKQWVNRLSATEHKWLVRLILKNMHFGLGDVHILKCYHEDAPALFNVTGDLAKVVRELWDPEKRIDGAADVRLNEPFRPMLADRMSVEDIVPGLGDQVIVEEKLDGERIQLHHDAAHNSIRYFSRLGNESTRLYATSLTLFINQSFSKSMVLDGEMMVYDAGVGRYLSYDLIKVVAANKSDDAAVHPIFIVFDILYYDRESTVHLELRERKALLESVCPVVEGRLVRLPYATLSSSAEISDKLDQILLNHGEGLVAKSLSSSYAIGERSKSWIKVKPDYIDSLCDDVDLLVGGVFLGKGLLGQYGSISGLLCFCQASDERYLSFCKVGSGFNREELSGLSMILSHALTDTPSADLLFVDTPDRFVDITACRVIVRVKGMSIVDSSVFACGKTFRSPRFVSIRTDKDCATTVQEIEALQLISMRSTVKRTLLPAPPVRLVVVADVFGGEQVYVHEGGVEDSREAMQAVVMRLNGQITELPTPDTKHIVAAGFDKPGMRLRSVLRQYPKCQRHTIDKVKNLQKNL